MLKYLAPALLLAATATAQVASYIPPALTALGSLNPKSGSAGSSLIASASVTNGNGPGHVVSVTYDGPGSVSAGMSSTALTVAITASDVIGSYQLKSVTFVDATGITVYNRNGTISRFFYASTLPTTHTFNFAALDFTVVAGTPAPPPPVPPPAPAAPSITTQPVNVRVNAGQSAGFAVTASSQTPLAVQWRKNGTPVTGATGNQLTFPSATTADSGNYDAVITNAGGAVTSSAASLVVDAGRVKNISVRVVVPDGGVLTAGFVLDSPKAVLVRGIGRSLEQFGVTAGTTMPNPRVEIFNSAGIVVAQADDYIATSAVTATMARVGAFGISSPQDAAVVVTLPAGAFTVQLRPVGGRGGDALVEVYDVD